MVSVGECLTQSAFGFLRLPPAPCCALAAWRRVLIKRLCPLFRGWSEGRNSLTNHKPGGGDHVIKNPARRLRARLFRALHVRSTLHAKALVVLLARLQRVQFRGLNNTSASVHIFRVYTYNNRGCDRISKNLCA